MFLGNQSGRCAPYGAAQMMVHKGVLLAMLWCVFHFFALGCAFCVGVKFAKHKCRNEFDRQGQDDGLEKELQEQS